MQDINVHIGMAKVGRNQCNLHALLGSCVGIGLLWEENNIYGLSHCLLSKSPHKQFTLGGRYVDQAIFSLLRLMKAKPEHYKELKAVVAGGGNMTKPGVTNPEKLVGHINSQFAIKCLEEKKIEIIRQDFGGEEGRKISILCESGDYNVRTIPRNI